MQKVRRHLSFRFLKKFRLLIELLIQVYFTALFTFKGYNFQYIISSYI